MLGFNEEQLDAMRALRIATFEFASHDGNRYLPSEYTLEVLV